MKMSETFRGSYLKASDFMKPALLTIKKCWLEVMPDESTKPAVSFVEADRPLILNKTNAITLAELYGDEADDWAGHKIVAYCTNTDFGGKRVACIRLRAPKKTQAEKDDERHASLQVDQGPDEIPF